MLQHLLHNAVLLQNVDPQGLKNMYKNSPTRCLKAVFKVIFLIPNHKDNYFGISEDC